MSLARSVIGCYDIGFVAFSGLHTCMIKITLATHLVQVSETSWFLKAEMEETSLGAHTILLASYYNG